MPAYPLPMLPPLRLMPERLSTDDRAVSEWVLYRGGDAAVSSSSTTIVKHCQVPSSIDELVPLSVAGEDVAGAAGVVLDLLAEGQDVGVGGPGGR